MPSPQTLPTYFPIQIFKVDTFSRSNPHTSSFLAFDVDLKL